MCGRSWQRILFRSLHFTRKNIAHSLLFFARLPLCCCCRFPLNHKHRLSLCAICMLMQFLLPSSPHPSCNKSAKAFALCFAVVKLKFDMREKNNNFEPNEWVCLPFSLSFLNILSLNVESREFFILSYTQTQTQSLETHSYIHNNRRLTGLGVWMWMKFSSLIQPTRECIELEFIQPFSLSLSSLFPFSKPAWKLYRTKYFSLFFPLSSVSTKLGTENDFFSCWCRRFLEWVCVWKYEM